MDWNGCSEIELIPGKLAGQPVILQSRVPVASVLDSAAAGETVHDIAYSFDLPPERVRRVLEFAAGHSSLRHTA